MCQRLSAIVTRPLADAPARFIPCEFTRHHSAQLAAEGIERTRALEQFVRLENVLQPDGSWEMKVDEKTVPTWYDDELRNFVADQYSKWIDRITIRKDRPALLGGTWIVLGEVTITHACNCGIIVGPQAKLTLGDILESVEVDLIGAGTLKTDYIAGTLKTGCIGGTLTTDYITGTLKTGYIAGTLTTGGIGGTLTTGGIGGTLKTGCIAGTLTTGYIAGTLTTGGIGGTLKTGCIAGTLTTGYIAGTLTTNYIAGTLTTGGIASEALVGHIAKAYLDGKIKDTKP